MKLRATDQRRDAAGIRSAIEQFIQACQQPSLLEPGEEFFELKRDRYSLEQRNARLTIEAWDERRNLARRIVDIQANATGRLELVVERFGGKQGKLWLVDRASPKTDAIVRRGGRLVFQSRFQAFLARQFPRFRIAEITSEPDLEHSLSPTFPRALLIRGDTGIAAIAAPPEDTSGAVVSFGVIWFDYLKRRSARLRIRGLILYLPQGREHAACRRILHLDPDRIACDPYGYSADQEGPLDPSDYGNLDTALQPFPSPGEPDPLAELLGIDRIAAFDGVSYRVNGLEFARTRNGKCSFGLGRAIELRDHRRTEVHALVEHLRVRRCPRQGDARDPLYAQAPEAWLESKVRESIEEVDASLRKDPVYGQVPAWEGGDRGVMDLLAVDYSGRLAVLELKAGEDLHLPFQALDYWMRVKWHLERGDFEINGYFRGLPLRREPPRILLVSPALEVHPANQCLISYLRPEIDVQHIGVAADWRANIRVMFRKCRTS